MSQIHKALTSSGPIPPNIPTQFTTDVDGPAVPIANNINLYGNVLYFDDVAGIITQGPPGSGGNDTINIGPGNSFQASGTVSDASTHIIYTVDLSGFTTPAVYLFNWNLVLYNSTSSLGAAYQAQVPIRIQGGIATGIIPQDYYVAEEGAMSSVVVSSGPSGSSFEITLQGYNTDTIKYKMKGSYVVVS